MGKSQQLYRQARHLIPGGTQLLSKRPEMFLPNLWPAYYTRAKGCEICDLDNKKYIDVSTMGLGACILGYADNTVDNAVIQAIGKGNLTTLNAPEEVELAQLLLKYHPWAHNVRYARTGGEAMAMAVRIARAATGQDKILFCGYHGWHDWYLAANLDNDRALDGYLLPGLEPLGVPRSLINSAIPFRYNNIQEFKKKFNRYKHELAAVVMEPIRNTYPVKGFLETIRYMTEKNKSVLIFDEITSGFRLCVGGAHLVLGSTPDIAVLGKAISNGFPMSAIIGKRKVMTFAQESFISSTYWTDRSGPTAALATMRKMEEKNVVRHLSTIGKYVQQGWNDLAKKHNISITISGIYPLGQFTFVYKNAQAIKTLMTQLLLEKGFLASTVFYASFSHKKKYIEKYLDRLDDVFNQLHKAITTHTVEKKLKGPIAHAGFKRLL